MEPVKLLIKHLNAAQVWVRVKKNLEASEGSPALLSQFLCVIKILVGEKLGKMDKIIKINNTNIED